MGDDYQYQIQPLPPKKSYGGNAASNALNDVTPPDPYPIASTTLQNESNVPPDTGGSGGNQLPNGVQGDMLYHNGTAWVTFHKPDLASVLVTNTTLSPHWVEGSDVNDLLFFGPANTWVRLAAPDTSGTFVLGVVDGEMKWMDTENCDTP